MPEPDVAPGAETRSRILDGRFLKALAAVSLVVLGALLDRFL